MSGLQEGTERRERPGRIDAVAVRHPWRWVAVAVIAVLVAMFVQLLVFNEAFRWPFVFEAMNQNAVIRGLLWGTLFVTVVAMALAIVLGVVLAIMRLSDNPVLSGVAFVWIWFFRAVPRLVLLYVMGSLGVLFQKGLHIGVPFLDVWGPRLGLPDGVIWTLDANALFVGLLGGIVGLALSESAYMAEIARAGILSVDSGQREAAQALGMSSGQSMRKVVLPQALRVIVPPTGNETIAMLKDTSLLIGIPVTTELFYQLQQIGTRTYQVFPVLVAAILYYLIISSVFMIIQMFLERRFGRGQLSIGGTTR